MITVIVISAVSCFVMFSMVARIHTKMFSIMRGHDVLTDVIYTLAFTGLAVAGGSLTGLMISVVTGLFISLTLITTKRYMGYTRIVRRVNELTGKKYWFKWDLKSYPAVKQSPIYVPIPKVILARI
jgi:hypothetical protein